MDLEQTQIDQAIVNNDYYNHLHEKWYEASSDPIALLRAENLTKLPWIASQLSGVQRGLDVGCGGGFGCNYLAKEGHQMTGLDLSESSLAVARSMDTTASVDYIYGDAYQLPFQNETFDFVICLDFLEHVSKPEKVIQEISRVLKPNGSFFFHTFSRNFLSWLVVIKGMEWFVRNTPAKLHVYKLFLNPSEVEKFCDSSNMSIEAWTGCAPKVNGAFFKMLWSGQVPDNFEFQLTRTMAVSYLGRARKAKAT